MASNPQDGGKPEGFNQREYIDTALRAVHQKKPVEIDFTLHTMEDGTQVSTLERVCKGMFSSTFPLPSLRDPQRSPFSSQTS